MNYNNEYLDKFYGQYEKYVLKDGEKENIYYRIIRHFIFGLIRTDYGEWMKAALNRGDMQNVNNVIYHQCKVNLLPRNSGYDHCGNFLPVMEAIACGYYEAVEHCYPRTINLPSNGHTMYVVASNLLMGIWYQDDHIINKIQPKAEKYLNGKGNQWDKSVVSYLYNLYKNDEDGANKDLSDICNGFSRQDFSADKKILCVLAHGLATLAYLKYPDIAINLPTAKNFSREFAVWRRENPTPELKLYIEYPPELDEVNRVLQHDIAYPIIQQPYLENKFLSAVKRKQWVLDDDQMQKNLANEIAGIQDEWQS